MTTRTRVAAVLTPIAVVAAVAIAGGGPIALSAQQPPPQAPREQPSGARENLTPAPNRRADEGKGPFKTFVIRGVMLIDGYGNVTANIWLLLFPMICVAALTVAFTFLGDGLRDALDPYHQ